jgi:hypothetical protein
MLERLATCFIQASLVRLAWLARLGYWGQCCYSGPSNGRIVMCVQASCTHLRAARLFAASLHPFGVPLSSQSTMARCGRQPILQASIAVMLGVLTLSTALSLIAAHQHNSLAKDERIEPTPTSTHPVSECTCMRTR